MTEPAATSDGGAQRALPGPVVMLVGLAGFVIVIGGLRAASSIVSQVFLALVLTVAVFPVQRYLIQRNWPRWTAFVAGALTVSAIFIAITASVILAIARFGTLLTGYEQQAADDVSKVTDQLNQWGVGVDQQKLLSNSVDPARLASLIGDLLGAVASLGTSAFFILTVLFFMALDAYHFPTLLERVAVERPTQVKALSDWAHTTRVYYVVSTIFGFIVAVIDAIALALLSVPGAVAWGVLAFVTNYIPNIGFVLGLIPPAALALLDGGVGTMVAVIVAYSAINFVIQSLIQPKFVADAVGLSPTITIISLLFWTWVLGALGALLAVPASLFVRAVLVDANERAAWLIPLIASDPRAKPNGEPRPSEPPAMTERDKGTKPVI